MTAQFPYDRLVPETSTLRVQPKHFTDPTGKPFQRPDAFVRLDRFSIAHNNQAG